MSVVPALLPHQISAALALRKGSSRREPAGPPLCFLEASGVESREERPGGWAPQLLRKLWLKWFPVSDSPKTQEHE